MLKENGVFFFGTHVGITITRPQEKKMSGDWKIFKFFKKIENNLEKIRGTCWIQVKHFGKPFCT